MRRSDLESRKASFQDVHKDSDQSELGWMAEDAAIVCIQMAGLRGCTGPLAEPLFEPPSIAGRFSPSIELEDRRECTPQARVHGEDRHQNSQERVGPQPDWAACWGFWCWEIVRNVELGGGLDTYVGSSRFSQLKCVCRRHENTVGESMFAGSRVCCGDSEDA